jgi:hypothetical protein
MFSDTHSPYVATFQAGAIVSFCAMHAYLHDSCNFIDLDDNAILIINFTLDFKIIDYPVIVDSPMGLLPLILGGDHQKPST